MCLFELWFSILYIFKVFVPLRLSSPVFVNALKLIPQNVFCETLVLKDTLREANYMEKFKVYFFFITFDEYFLFFVLLKIMWLESKV